MRWRTSGVLRASGAAIVLGLLLGCGDSTGPGSTITVTGTVYDLHLQPRAGASVMVNDSYLFQPSATDADGDSLTFSISNKPDWASFNGSSGRLSGTPGEGDEGVYSNIVIGVTDGTDTAELPPFSIQVEALPASAAGTLTVNWVAPASRTDGTPLSLADIEGFRIYYGATAGSYPNRIEVADGSAQSATVNDVPVGTYYVVMTTYDVDGLESGYSEAVSMTVK